MKIKIPPVICIIIFLLYAISSLIGAVKFQDGNYNQDDSDRKKFSLKEETSFIKIGETTVKIVVNKNSKTDSAYLYFNMHDNENTAVEAAKKITGKFGGTLLELQSDGERAITFSLKKTPYTFDPNRIFTKTGIKKTLAYYGKNSPNARKEISRFADKLAKDYFKNVKIMIAVHNNTDENYSIKSYEKGGEYEADAKLVYINPDADEDDFFYVTEEKFFNFLKDKNFNVVLQDNEKVIDDGSLSIYCGDNKISYINVESEHNHLKEQEKMLEVLQELLRKRKRASKS